MYKLKKEDVLHVASLAKLYVPEELIDKYKKDLEDILNNIDDIENLDISSDIMVSPSKNINVFSSYSNNEKSDVLRNAKNKRGNFIKVEDMR